MKMFKTSVATVFVLFILQGFVEMTRTAAFQPKANTQSECLDESPSLRSFLPLMSVRSAEAQETINEPGQARKHKEEDEGVELVVAVQETLNYLGYTIETSTLIAKENEEILWELADHIPIDELIETYQEREKQAFRSHLDKLWETFVLAHIEYGLETQQLKEYLVNGLNPGRDVFSEMKESTTHSEKLITRKKFHLLYPPATEKMINFVAFIVLHANGLKPSVGTNLSGEMEGLHVFVILPWDENIVFLLDYSGQNLCEIHTERFYDRERNNYFLKAKADIPGLSAGEEDLYETLAVQYRTFQKTGVKGTTYGIYFNLSLAYWFLGDVDQAFAMASKALKLNPTGAPAYLLAGSYLKAVGSDEWAEKFFQLGLSLNAKHPGLLIELGKCSLARGEVERAGKHLERALQRYPRYDENGEAVDFRLLLEQPNPVPPCANQCADVDREIVLQRAKTFYKECRLRSRLKRLNPLVIYDLADHGVRKLCMGMKRFGKDS